MKNSITSFGRTIKQEVKWVLVVIVLVLTVNSIAQSTNQRYCFIVSRSSSGNGFGAFYHPGISMNIGRSEIDLAVNFQQRKMNFAGGQLSFRYNYFEGDNSPGQRIGLFSFSDVKYISNAYLNKRSAKMEQWVDREAQTDFSTLKFTTVEAYIGFGAKYTASNSINVYSSIGFGGYCTLSGKSNLHREYNSQSLCLKAGIIYSIFSK